jgi:hypothetical protein
MRLCALNLLPLTTGTTTTKAAATKTTEAATAKTAPASP